MHGHLLGAEVGAPAQVVQRPAALAPPGLRALLAGAPHCEELQSRTWPVLTRRGSRNAKVSLTPRRALASMIVTCCCTGRGRRQLQAGLLLTHIGE